MDTLDLNGSLDWEPFDVPGGTEPVSLLRLRAERGARAFTVLVRFPEGWKRPTPGFYEAAEDVVFLAGELTINDATYRAGEWAHLPVGYPRRSSLAHAETLAVARFSGSARWRDGEGGASAEPALQRTLTFDGGARSPLGTGAGVLLRAGSPDSSWIVDAPPPGASSPIDAELLDVAARAWAFVPAGEPFPTFAGRFFCRTFEGSPG